MDMVIQHLLDSLAIAKFVQGDAVLDIGSGGGFPGIPLAIYLANSCPEATVTLLDSRGKRVEFLRHAVATLGLKNALPVKTRVEDFRPEQTFDTLICRAFSSLTDMLIRTEWLQSEGTRFIAMKGKWPYEEIDQLGSLQNKLHVNVEVVSVPFMHAERHAVIIEF